MNEGEVGEGRGSVCKPQRRAIQGMRRDTPLPIQGRAVASFCLLFVDGARTAPPIQKVLRPKGTPPVAWSGSNSLSGAPAASSFPSFGLPRQGMVLGELSEDGPGAALPSAHTPLEARGPSSGSLWRVLDHRGPPESVIPGRIRDIPGSPGNGKRGAVRLSHSQV